MFGSSPFQDESPLYLPIRIAHWEEITWDKASGLVFFRPPTTFVVAVPYALCRSGGRPCG